MIKFNKHYLGIVNYKKKQTEEKSNIFHDIYMIDTSGSMKTAAQRALESSIDYQKKKNSNNKFTIISFAEFSYQYTGTWNEFKIHDFLHNRNGTYMCDAIHSLKQLQKTFKHIRLTVFTDGSLHDKDKAENLISLLPFVFDSVQGIRYGSNGNTDIIAKFTIKTASRMCKIYTTNNENEFRDILNKCPSTVNVSHEGCQVSAVPGGQLSNSLALPLNSIYLIKPTIRLVDADDSNAYATKDMLCTYLQQIMQYLKTTMLTSTILKETADAIRKFVNEVETFFTEERKSISKSKARQEVALLRSLKENLSTEKTLLTELRQLLNGTIAHRMNQDQKAIWLVSANLGKAARRLDKNIKSGSDLMGILRRFISLECKDNEDNKDEDQYLIDYISQQTTCELIDALKKEGLEGVSHLDLQQLLSIAGCVGYAVSVNVSAYPDPWCVRVQTVYNLFVSQTAFAGNKLQYLKVPGHVDKKVNGAVPVGYYAKKTLDLSDLHSARVLRGDTPASITGDNTALAVAACIFLLGKPHEWHRIALDQIIDTLPVRYFSSINVDEISNISQLVGKYLCLKSATKLEMDYLWFMMLYFKAKHKNWDADMSTIVGFDKKDVAFNKKLFTRDDEQKGDINMTNATNHMTNLGLFSQEDLNFLHALVEKVKCHHWVPNISFVWFAIKCGGKRSNLKDILTESVEKSMKEHLIKLKDQHYDTLLREKEMKEHTHVTKFQIDAMLKCKKEEEFVEFLNGGNSVETEYGKQKSIPFETPSSDICKRFTEEFLKKEKNLDLVWILTTCRDKVGNPLWNNGNLNRDHRLEEILKNCGDTNITNKYKKFKIEYCIKRYRDGTKENRHGHSNDKPSFYSLSDGKCNTKKEYFLKFLKNDPCEIAAYNEIHYNCCGNRV